MKALFFKAEKPYNDFGDLLQIARAEACKVLGAKKVKILNVLYCPYPKGWVVVVQNLGGKGKKEL